MRPTLRRDGLILGVLALVAVGVAVVWLRPSRGPRTSVATVVRVAPSPGSSAMLEAPGDMLATPPPVPAKTPEPTRAPEISSATYDRPMPTAVPSPGASASSDASSAIGPNSIAQAPELLTKVEPKYPEAARKARMEGQVGIEAEITAEGSVRDPRVVHAVNPLLDESALTAVRQWKYRPVLVDGKPVRTYVAITVTFSLH